MLSTNRTPNSPSDGIELRPETPTRADLPNKSPRPNVRLDSDHPGFSDIAYRARRNEIAQIAAGYKPGSDIPDAPYTAEEHEVWRIVRAELEPQHRRHACAEYLEYAGKLALPHHRIPQLNEVTAKLEAVSGFRLAPVTGLVKLRVFLESLANGVFLSTQYIRHHSVPLYTPEPDVVHELIGHASMLASPRFAELSRLVGSAVKRTESREDLEKLGRIYWFTIEFGVVREMDDIKAYGAGLLSSAGELAAMSNAEIRPFDLDAVPRLSFDATKYQPVLFCADSFEAMYHTLREHLLQWK